VKRVLAAATALVVTILAARFLHGPSILLPALLLPWPHRLWFARRQPTPVQHAEDYGRALSVWRRFYSNQRCGCRGRRRGPFLPARIDGKSCLYSRPFRNYLYHNCQLTNVFATGDEVWQTGGLCRPFGGCVSGEIVQWDQTPSDRAAVSQSRSGQPSGHHQHRYAASLSTGTRSSVCAFACCFSVGGLRWNVRGLRRARENRCRRL
jgi:hypothetical protein